MDGAVVSQSDKPISGLELPVGEVPAAASQNDHEHGLARPRSRALTTRSFATKDVTKLQNALFGDLAKQGGVEGQFLTSIPKTTDFLSAFIIELGLAAKPANDLRFPPPGTTQLTGLQTSCSGCSGWRWAAARSMPPRRRQATRSFGEGDFVQFDLHGSNPGTGEISFRTDEEGDANIDLQGKRQKYKLPPDTQPFDRNVTIMAGLS